MTEPSSGRDPLEQIAEDFIQRLRRGERPPLTEYTDKYPELAGQIRELFPALMVMEEFGSLGDRLTGASGRQPFSSDGVPGQLGEYRILREVGRGGMGVVYEAVQESLGRHVALKVLPFHGAVNPMHLERFRREVQAAAKLHHTNIVSVFGVGEFQGIHYYAMQFIQGHGLDTVLREVKGLREAKGAATVVKGAGEPAPTVSVAQGLLTGRFPSQETSEFSGAPAAPVLPHPAVPAESPDWVLGAQSELAGQTEFEYFRSVARLGVQVAEALDYAHHHGILHRDIKPSNLILDAEGTVWVTDFGLAKLEGSEDLTNTGDILGTLRYMAPERFQGVSGPAGDVYSLGMTLFEMLTLQPAFQDTDRARLMRRVSHEEPPHPRQLDRRIPLDLETIVLKALAKDPAHRYQTAKAMAEDLDRFLADRPIWARRTSLPERVWRWCRRNPALAAACGLALAALVAVAVVSFILAVQKTRDAAALLREKDKTQALLTETQRVSAGLAVDKSLSLCDKGEVGPGMLWLAHSLDLTDAGAAPDLERAIRMNLTAWQRRLCPLKAFLPHPDVVAGVAFSPDSRIVVTGCWDGKARLWDRATGTPIGNPFLHLGRVRAVAFAPDGRTVVVGGIGPDGKKGVVWLWDTVTGKPVLDPPIQTESEIRALAIPPGNGKTVLTGAVDGSSQLWDVSTGRPVLKQTFPHKGQVQAVAFSPDGKTVLTGSLDRTACLWDAATGTKKHTMEHAGEVWAVAFSPDGKTVLTGSLDRRARLWDAVTGDLIGKPLVQEGGVTAVAFSPDGRTILTGSADGVARLWEAGTWKPASPTLQHGGAVPAAAFTPDGHTILTGSKDGNARLWEVNLAKAESVHLSQPGEVFSAVFSPDAKKFMTGNADKTAQIWDVTTGRPLLAQPLPVGDDVLAVAFDPRKQVVATGDTQSCKLWWADTGKPFCEPLRHPGSSVWAIAFHPDGREIATGTVDGALRLWEVEKGKPGKLVFDEPLRHQETVRAVEFSPDGKRIVTGSWDRSARLWDVATGQPLGPPLAHFGPVWAVAFQPPDGRTVLTAGRDRTARLWDVATGQPTGLPIQSQDTIVSVAFSPDGRAFLTGSMAGTGRLWDVATGKPLGPPLALEDWVLAVAFRPDGGILASNGKEIQSGPLPGPVGGNPERLSVWIQVITGMELDAGGAVHMLEAGAWEQRRQRLEQLGGSPIP